MPRERHTHRLLNHLTGSLGAVVPSALAGCAAAAPRLAAMRLATPPDEPVPPRRVAVGLAAKVGAAEYLGPRERQALTLVGHFAFGATAATPFCLMASPNVTRSAVRGAAFGLGVWAASYSGWVPLAGILPPPWRKPMRRSLVTVGSHLLWGAAMGAAAGVLLRDRESGAIQGRAPATDQVPVL